MRHLLAGLLAAAAALLFCVKVLGLPLLIIKSVICYCLIGVVWAFYILTIGTCIYFLFGSRRL